MARARSGAAAEATDGRHPTAFCAGGQLSDALIAMAQQRPDAPALAWAGGTLSFAELDTAAAGLAAAVAGAGAAGGDRVSVVAPNGPALVVGMVAAWRGGMVAVPVSARLRSDDLAAALHATRPRVVVTVGRHQGFDFAEHVGARRGELGAGMVVVDHDGRPERRILAPSRAGVHDDPACPPGTALILTTSGTTGSPKAVLVSARRELNAAVALADRLRLRAGERVVLPVPASHAFGLSCLLSTLLAGATAILLDGMLAAETLCEALGANDAGVLHGSPAVFAAISDPGRLGGLTLSRGLVAGAPCPSELLQRLDSEGVRLLDLYGTTEIGAAACPRLDDPPAVRYETCGDPLPGYELRATDGVLEVRGPDVTAGYFGAPALTAAAFDGGWFRTGDLADWRDGRVRIQGRRDDVANVGGFTVSPAEVEAGLLGHPEAVAAVVVATPDAVRGDRLAAFVVPRRGSALDGSTLLRHLRSRLAGYKLPYRIHVVDELPMLATGKPDREALRRQAGADQ